MADSDLELIAARKLAFEADVSRKHLAITNPALARYMQDVENIEQRHARDVKEAQSLKCDASIVTALSEIKDAEIAALGEAPE